MKIVGERLAAQDPDKRPEIIWINTWQYAQLGAETQTAGALLWEICRKVAQVESAQTVQAREKRRRFITQAQQFLVAASVGAAKGATRLAGYGAVVDLGGNGKDLWDGLEQTDGGLEIPAADVTLLAELRESFASAIRDTGRRIVIFVDDLDRLEPARAVEVMEAIKVLLDVENCIFVLAIDFEKDAQLDERRETQLFAMLCMQTRYASVYKAFARAASSLDDEAADRQSEVLEGMLRVPQRVTPETERALPDAGTTEATAVRYTQFPEVPAEDVDMLEDFLKHLRTAFSTPGGKLDTGALLSAVTSSAVTARDVTRKVAGDVRTTADHETRFAALEASKARPQVISLLRTLDGEAGKRDVYFGMQGKAVDWTGYIRGMRKGNAKKDSRFYSVATKQSSFHFQFEKVTFLSNREEFEAAARALESHPGLSPVASSTAPDYWQIKNITTEEQPRSS